MKRLIFSAVFSILISCATVQADSLYWANLLDNGKIQKIELRGRTTTGIQTFLQGTPLSPVQCFGLTLDESTQQIYWTNDARHKIQRSNLDGTDVEDVVVGLSQGPRGIALDLISGKIYWAEPYQIQRANLDGTDVEFVVTPPVNQNLVGLALDEIGGKIYFTSVIGSALYRANLDGTGLEALVSTGLLEPSGIAIDLTHGKIYWADFLTNKIQRSDLEGANVEDVLTDLNHPFGIALDPKTNRMYWTEDSKLKVSNLDGKGVKDLVISSSNGFRAIALEQGKIQTGQRD